METTTYQKVNIVKSLLSKKINNKITHKQLLMDIQDYGIIIEYKCVYDKHELKIKIDGQIFNIKNSCAILRQPHTIKVFNHELGCEEIVCRIPKTFSSCIQIPCWTNEEDTKIIHSFFINLN